MGDKSSIGGHNLYDITTALVLAKRVGKRDVKVVPPRKPKTQTSANVPRLRQTKAKSIILTSKNTKIC